MNKIQVLDCTLRDGGYCNQWQFGFKNIKKITQSLTDARIDIVECGFLTDKIDNYDSDITKFNTLEQLTKVIPEKRKNVNYVAMVNYGEYNVDSLPTYNGKSIDGIRVAFHKKQLKPALEMCKAIKAKGYKVFIQAMVSLSYTDEEFLSLINMANEIEPYAFYIVDSFGMMKQKDLIRLFYMVEHNLKENIWIGFHSHNNMQLAYSNAQSLAEVKTNRNLIIDSSVYGMGRGAGNLNTEIFVDYLNENIDADYDIKPLLKIIDEILNDFYMQNYWGYSLPNYLSASYNAHPNYAMHLDDKKTLTIKDMNEIFNMMDEDKRYDYDKKYIEKIYITYMSHRSGQKNAGKLEKELKGKEVLLIAPGKSAVAEKQKIIEFVKNNNVAVISANFDYEYVPSDYIFISNLRRFAEFDKGKKGKCIVTSNIPTEDMYAVISYCDLLNSEEAVEDNAGMMAIKMLIKFGAKKIYLAGIDGYSHNHDENYGDKSMEFITKSSVTDKRNIGMANVLKQYSREIPIEFITTTKFEAINKDNQKSSNKIGINTNRGGGGKTYFLPNPKDLFPFF